MSGSYSVLVLLPIADYPITRGRKASQGQLDRMPSQR